jgi:hypothetical protein
MNVAQNLSSDQNMYIVKGECDLNPAQQLSALLRSNNDTIL